LKKPRNILVNSNCDAKICDFGFARTTESEVKEITKKLTGYVATRWYRSPELLTASNDYDGAVDMWSVGCILA